MALNIIMRDPHIEALYYKIKHGDHVDYSKAGRLELARNDFNVSLADGKAEVAMVAHCSSVEAARAVVEPYLRAWELDVNLGYGPGALEFVYERPAIIDRNPTPGVISMVALGGTIVLKGGSARMCVGFKNFPHPKMPLARDAAVDPMYARYVAYRQGRTLLGDAANYCRTALLLGANTNRRQTAAKHYCVADAILSKLGHLADSKGGAHARKAKGSAEEFTGAERQWLEEAMRVLIRRAAEVAYDPDRALPEITLADLPSLSR